MRFGRIVLVALLLLGACSSDPGHAEPTRTHASAGSAPPAATGPPMPAQAMQDSPAGAVAFVEHYIDVFNYAARTGDVDQLSRLSSPDCDVCVNYINLYRDTYEGQGDSQVSQWRVTSIKPSASEAGYVVATSVKASGVGTYDLMLTVAGGRITRFDMS